jgi:hypothetical protein
MKWWQEIIVWTIFVWLAVLAYTLLIERLPAGHELDLMLPVLIVVGLIVWRIWRRR